MLKCSGRLNPRFNCLRDFLEKKMAKNSGQITPVDVIVKLKEKYGFRVMLEESNLWGVLGATGQGLSKHYGVPTEKIDIITTGMDMH
ncbi:Long chain base biosynthesis protein 1c [Acorus calamus]|uniref:Long chain base biosynthesis protein 1c n=1 Tax=Acorus calamus TaxID=4465 RepID=A0AAV9DFM1_ACOCL|nr:Long chain base biosynthesis protein 1c [Acorus calamus]